MGQKNPERKPSSATCSLYETGQRTSPSEHLFINLHKKNMRAIGKVFIHLVNLNLLSPKFLLAIPREHTVPVMDSLPDIGGVKARAYLFPSQRAALNAHSTCPA